MTERRRSKYDIYADSIEVIAKKGISTLTRVSYGANMPVDRAKKVVGLLVSHGFIKEVDVGNRTKFRATKRGLEYLETYKRMQGFFAALEEPVTLELPEVVLPNRISTGYRDLDNLLLGGVPESYAVILTSPSCDERDLLVKGFVEEGVRSGQITFDLSIEAPIEAPGIGALVEEFRTKLFLFLCNPRADRIMRGFPNVTRLKGIENLTELGIALNSAFRGLGKAKDELPRRACIEIVSDVLLQHRAVHTRRWLSGLLPEFRSRGFTTLAVMNPNMHSPQEVHAILGLFDGEMNIYEKETESGSQKFLKVRKMHGQRYLDTKMQVRKEAMAIARDAKA